MIETSHSSKATRNHSTKRQKMEPILNSKSSFIRYSRPFYGKIAYSSEGFCLRSYEETEKKSVSRNCVDVAEEPTFSVEDILHDWMDYSKYESNEDDNSKITSSAKDQSDDAPFCLGTTKDHLPKFINDSKEAIDENYQVAEKIDKEPWVFWETFNRTQSSHSSNGSITTKNLLHNLEKPFFLPLKRFIPKTIDLKKLNTGNEFWSQTNLPLNVTNSTRNSFVIDRRFRQTKQCKLTKSTFENIFVINQVDRKFICCVVEENEKRFLLLIDQHAAHERVCLEKLMRSKSSCTLQEKKNIL